MKLPPDELFAAALSEITGRRIDVPDVEEDEFSTDANLSGADLRGGTSQVEIAREAREEKHLKDSIRALERLLFAHGDEAHTQGNGYDRARRALVEAIDEWNRLQPLLALPRLEDDQ